MSTGKLLPSLATLCFIPFFATAAITGGGGDTAVKPIDEEGPFKNEARAEVSAIARPTEKTLANGLHEAGHEIDGLARGAAVLERDEHDAIAVELGPVPASMLADECAAAELLREGRAGIER